ncbi:nuclear pore complex protein NUP133 [Vigna radiata var. radiata]|uniref:Nuclear pore complex protein NUP133 n=1 Tax=Vigna radiata var. radiata TaxID=3916 RepID=A0A1S3UFH4_VIGRR|nr:nuclear pore complex protein NUP133 [Vigna radiata var. radiata]
MFSCGTKKSNARVRREQGRGSAVADSPVTPARASFNDSAVPNRPSSGTPAPWAPRLSVLARVPQVNRSGKGDDADPTKPVFVGEFPQVVRDEQNILLHKRMPANDRACGGIDKCTSLAWIICGNRVYLWSYLSPASSVKCLILEIPLNDGDVSRNDSGSWLLRVVNCDVAFVGRNEVAKQCTSAAVVLCNCQTRAVFYWPDIYSQPLAPVTSIASSSELGAVFTSDGKASFNRQRRQSKLASGLSGLFTFNSMIASSVPNRKFACVALACSSSGELWQFQCTPTGIDRRKVFENIMHFQPQRGESVQTVSNVGYPRSLTWGCPRYSIQETNRQFLVLTDHEIQCFKVEFDCDIPVSKLWSQEIVGTDAEVGIKKDLAGQKRIWPLDMQVDDHGKVITILVATFCNDRISSSSYMQYSLLTMQYKSVLGLETTNDKVLEKKSPIEVIMPKARVEDEDFLFSMRLRIGGNPPGSAVIISGDGTATVSHYYRNSTRLYQFDLPYDAGKVLDASILPSADDYEEGAWVVLTEKAGIWAIPEKAVILGGVEPPERSLSRKGSSNERSAQEEIRNLTFAANVAPRRASSEAWSAGDKQRTVLSGIGRRTALDEESEALLNNLFNEFLSSGQIDRSLEKLETSGSFERDGETNVFVRMSKSIVDTLAKHWTTTRGAEILAMAVVSTQLLEKQQKHEKFLHFLALSKCHEELCSKQRHALQIILEHGEKLSAMIQLRELQNLISQNRSTNVDSSNSSLDIQMSGALWDMIQLVGERARRNTVLLMDRDNAEVFYSKVSDLEDLFYCLDKELEYVIRPEHLLMIQIQRACELSTACVTIIRTCFNYKNEHRLWYPPPEGLTPWYCQPIVRTGIWSVASVLLHLLNETSGLDKTSKLDLYNNLEALTEVLLEAYSGAVTAKSERGEERQGLLNEYWERRDTLLESLYQKVKEFEEAHKDSFEVAGEQNDETIMKLTSHLLSIAKQHGCYKVMWTICCDVNDSELLRNIMHESLRPDGGFSYYVFKKLHESRQFSQLLRLGEEFPEELSIFLREYQDLLWLHDLFLHQFSSASESLHTLALTQNMHSNSVAEEKGEQECQKTKLKLTDRKNLLYLSKIAAFAAGKDAGTQVKVDRIEADLKILKLQEEVMKRSHSIEDTQLVQDELLHPLDLINLCLESEDQELTLWAFDVFAWTSSSFRKINKSLLEDCWKKAASQDDWSKFYDSYRAEGWSDQEILQNLRNTILFQASSRCYGPRSETFEEGFDQVLPLRQENMEGSSVETILMQHKDFADAGKLMLMAIMLGSEHGGDMRIEEGPSPMD